MQSDSVAIVSGGLDSTTLVYKMLADGYTPHVLSFNYGQRHKKELGFISNTAIRLNLPHDIVDLSGLTHLISNSALTSKVEHDSPGFNKTHQEGQTIEVPEGHYASDNMALTVVPNRNMIMLSIAIGVAVNEKARTIGIGVHGGDHFVYPDCRPDFINAIQVAALLGNDGFHNFEEGTKPRKKVENSLKKIEAEESFFGEVAPNNYKGALYSPFLNATKADIAYTALQLGVPLESTWSCYKGEELHCGRCGTCVERLEAIEEALIRYNNGAHKANFIAVDRTQYADNTFWKTAERNS